MQLGLQGRGWIDRLARFSSACPHVESYCAPAVRTDRSGLQRQVPRRLAPPPKEVRSEGGDGMGTARCPDGPGLGPPRALSGEPVRAPVGLRRGRGDHSAGRRNTHTHKQTVSRARRDRSECTKRGSLVAPFFALSFSLATSLSSCCAKRGASRGIDVLFTETLPRPCWSIRRALAQLTYASCILEIVAELVARGAQGARRACRPRGGERPWWRREGDQRPVLGGERFDR